MGMSASQGRFLQLTWRNSQITKDLQSLSNQKDALTRDMEKVSKEYQTALNSKVLKWSNNSGVSYVDLSYSNLMTPNATNQYKPYLLTDSSGKVVIDSTYQKYAEMISPDGSAGGDWESNRTSVLASLIPGLDAETIEADEANILAVYKAKGVKNNAQAAVDKAKAALQETGSASKFLTKMNSGIGVSGLSFSNNKSSWDDAYKSNSIINIGTGSSARNNVSNLIDTIIDALGKYTMTDSSNINTAKENAKQELCGSSNISDTNPTENTTDKVINWQKDHYEVNVKSFVDMLLAYLSSAGALETSDSASTYGDTTYYTWYNTDNTKLMDNYTTAVENLSNAQDDYDSTASEANQLLSSDIENQIDFYDEIFSSIADLGWTYNENVSDTDYLNQLLQNNIYSITTVNRTSEYNEDDGSIGWANEYSTDIASNCTKVVSVNDSNAANKALVEYESKKNIINAKETKIDNRMNNLETEQAAIKQMMQGIEQVEKDNIERTFSIFS